MVASRMDLLIARFRNSAWPLRGGRANRVHSASEIRADQRSEKNGDTTTRNPRSAAGPSGPAALRAAARTPRSGL